MLSATVYVFHSRRCNPRRVVRTTCSPIHPANAATATTYVNPSGNLTNTGAPTSGSTFQLTNPGTGHTFNATIFYAADTSSMGLTGGNDVVIQFMPVPEPAAVFVFAAAGLVAARGWRRVTRG
jgi:hypothetical protein